MLCHLFYGRFFLHLLEVSPWNIVVWPLLRCDIYASTISRDVPVRKEIGNELDVRNPIPGKGRQCVPFATLFSPSSDPTQPLSFLPVKRPITWIFTSTSVKHCPPCNAWYICSMFFGFKVHNQCDSSRLQISTCLSSFYQHSTNVSEGREDNAPDILNEFEKI
jgi:hypothetical protein